MAEPKLTVIMSPRHGTGTTTLGNYLALDIANDKSFGGLVLYIEFSKDTGKSLYMQKRLSERRRSLANVVYDVNTLQDNILKSMHSDRLFVLALNIHDDFLKISSYSNEISSKLVSEAFKKFDHVIFDLPADFKENIVGSTIGRRFTHDIHNLIIVLDEDALTFKDLSNLSSYLRLGNEIKPLYVTYVSNKVTKHYVDFIGQKLEMPLIKPLNLIKVPFMEEMTDCCNRGDLKSLGTGKTRKEFDASISKLKEIVLSQKRIVGIGVKPVLPDEDDILYGEQQDDGTEQNTKKNKFNLFGSRSKVNNKTEKKHKSKSNLFSKKNKESENPTNTDYESVNENYNEPNIEVNEDGELNFDLDFGNIVENSNISSEDYNVEDSNDFNEDDFLDNNLDNSLNNISNEYDDKSVQETKKSSRKSLFGNNKFKKSVKSQSLPVEDNNFEIGSDYNDEYDNKDKSDIDFDEGFNVDFDEDFNEEPVKNKKGFFKTNKQQKEKDKGLFGFKNKTKNNVTEKANNKNNKMSKFRKNK